MHEKCAKFVLKALLPREFCNVHLVLLTHGGSVFERCVHHRQQRQRRALFYLQF